MSLASQFAACVGVLSLACGLFAQSSGSISGTVKDSHGGVVPGASVDVNEPSAGVRQSVQSNDAGIFVFPQLPPGTYTLTVEKTGFKKTAHSDVVLPIASKIAPSSLTTFADHTVVPASSIKHTQW